MYMVVVYFDDYEHRPYQEVHECYTLKEVEKIKKEYGPDQKSPIRMEIVVKEVN